MGCENPKYIVQDTVIAGETGAAGPIGPAGVIDRAAILPIYTSEITHNGNERTNEVMNALMDELLYIPIAISNYLLTVGAQVSAAIQVQLGATVTSISFGWSINKTATSQAISGPQVSASVPPGTIIYTATGLAITSDATYALTIGDGTTSPVSNATVAFLNNRYWGAAGAPGSIDSAFVKGLSNNELTTTRSKTFTVTAGANDYIWYAYPKRFGLAIFSFSGIEGGFDTPSEITLFVNEEGYTEPYYVFRSTTKGLGATTLTAS